MKKLLAVFAIGLMIVMTMPQADAAKRFGGGSSFGRQAPVPALSQKAPAASSTNPFTDVAAGTYYAHAVLWAVKEDVTKGTSDTKFSPDANCTRAQIVTFIWRCKK